MDTHASEDLFLNITTEIHFKLTREPSLKTTHSRVCKGHSGLTSMNINTGGIQYIDYKLVNTEQLGIDR